VSIESFANHHLTRAHTWEHIALVPSRIVAGNRAPEAQLNAIKAALVSQPRDEIQLLNDSQKMWRRIAEHRVKPIGLDSMFSKLREGGLMQAEYLAACLILHAGYKLPITSVDFDDLLALIEDSKPLDDAIQFWRIQQLWERLLGKSEKTLASVPAEYLATMLEQLEVGSVDQLIAKKELHSTYVQRRMKQFFAANILPSEELESWLESKVNWL
jgi:glutamate-ammonia-ligase adenylyltransferase